MSKRNRNEVLDKRREKKELIGKQVQHKDVLKNPVQAQNQSQKQFLQALPVYDAVIFNAPAGCGKTYISMCECTDWLKKGLFDKMVLTRPSVGMGKTLGLLPGSMREKFEPYLLPMVDVICERYGKGFYESSINNGTIEFSPLEYVRGRNFSHLVVVDEAQNLTPDEAYTLLTRIADGGKLIMIGDPNQNDLRGKNAMEWLPDFIDKNKELREHIAMLTATSDDIVRGGLCKKMVKAKERSLR